MVHTHPFAVENVFWVLYFIMDLFMKTFLFSGEFKQSEPVPTQLVAAYTFLN